ncbi:tight adherance operon protein [Yersinia thracica]|uniref:tight adherance operon protein n=1 Tax=Yersinia thracica TaxID=2890319 RepID=UPI0011A4C06D|nr:tight adherance operon protein [Yersinia thracica]
MNRKLLLLSSLLIIAIGLTGLLMGSEDDKKIMGNLTTPSKEKEVTIILAQATRDLPSGTLLTHTKYVIKKIIVPESSELIKNDISENPNIDSYLLKMNTLSGSYITKDMLASPESEEFNHLSLQKGHVIYKFFIKQQDDYLFDALSAGDEISFQLRILETNKSKGMEYGTIVDTKSMSDRKTQSYSLNKIIPNMKIVRIKKYSVDELSEKNSNNQKTEDMLTGYIAVIIKTEELDLIHIVEKTGDIFLTPNYKNDDSKKISTNLYDIIPKLRTTRELRG